MREKILEVLEQICGTDEVVNNGDINLFKTGLLDSLGVVELLVGIEEKFGVVLDPAEIDRSEIETPNKLVDYLSHHIS